MMMSASARNRNPFTATQWQELEQQALIFKYMAAGMPIPPDLLFPIKRSLDHHSAAPSRLFTHQPMDWGCFQMGFGRKVDPEPGRCRRTDGKKWRCSKEAYGDSKYCERHMHRGRNRSRKPVEVNTTTTTPPTTNSSIPINSFSNRIPSSTTINHPSSYPFSSSTGSEKLHHPYNNNNNTSLHTFLYPHPSAASQNNKTHLVLDSGSYSHSQADHREEVDERAFFSEASGTLRSIVPESSLKDPWQLTPLKMNSSSSQSDYSQFHLQQNQPKEQHCFVLGTDLRATSYKEESQQPLRHFFDEWPPKSKDSWLGLDEARSDHSSHSTTQLSISLPLCSKDLFK